VVKVLYRFGNSCGSRRGTFFVEKQRWPGKTSLHYQDNNLGESELRERQSVTVTGSSTLQAIHLINRSTNAVARPLKVGSVAGHQTRFSACGISRMFRTSNLLPGRIAFVSYFKISARAVGLLGH